MRLLGHGVWARNYLVEKKTGVDKGELYAMKVLKKSKVLKHEKLIEHVQNEREVLEVMIHCPFNATLRYAFQTTDKLFLITDFNRGGDLFTLLSNHGCLDENVARFYLAEVVLAIQQMHKQNIVYRDLKAENVMLNTKGHVVLGDYGAAKALKNELRTFSFCGTFDAIVSIGSLDLLLISVHYNLHQQAPEMFSKGNQKLQSYVGPIVDWWAFGVLMVELLTGALPFVACDVVSQPMKILNHEPEIVKEVSQEAKDLIHQLLQKDPEQRLGFKNDANDLKSHPFFADIDWKKIATQHGKPPMVPKLTGPYDFKYFEDCEETIDIDDEVVHDQGKFQGYYFVATDLEELESPNAAQNQGQLKMVKQKRPSIENIRVICKNKRSKVFKKYRLLDTIEEGSFCVCVRCVVVETGLQVAVKVTELSYDASEEIANLIKCQEHKNVVKLIEVLRDSHYQYLVFELLPGGDLFHRQSVVKVFEEPLARSIFRQILDVTKFIHSKEIVHRDLKLENFVFVDDKEYSLLKVIDFGFACKTSTQNAMIAVSLAYAAPESLKSGPIKASSDVWSLGVVLFVMLSGRLPFENSNEDSNNNSILINSIKSGDFAKSSHGWRNLSTPAKDLITKILKVNEAERLTIDQIFEHPWMQNVQQVAKVPRFQRDQQSDVIHHQNKTSKDIQNPFVTTEGILPMQVNQPEEVKEAQTNTAAEVDVQQPDASNDAKESTEEIRPANAANNSQGRNDEKTTSFAVLGNQSDNFAKQARPQRNPKKSLRYDDEFPFEGITSKAKRQRMMKADKGSQQASALFDKDEKIRKNLNATSHKLSATKENDVPKENFLPPYEKKTKSQKRKADEDIGKNPKRKVAKFMKAGTSRVKKVSKQ